MSEMKHRPADAPLLGIPHELGKTVRYVPILPLTRRHL